MKPFFLCAIVLSAAGVVMGIAGCGGPPSHAPRARPEVVIDRVSAPASAEPDSLSLSCTPGPKPPSATDADVVTPDLAPHIPADMTVLARADGDLDGNGCSDVAVALRRKDEDQVGVDEAEPARPLLILTRRAGGELELAARNDHLVLCARCGGILGDPFHGIIIEAGTLKVAAYGGSSTRWSIEHVFEWSARAKTWVLREEVRGTYHMSDFEGDHEIKKRTAKDFGEVRFEDARAESE